MPRSAIARLAFIGFGEAARTFLGAWDDDRPLSLGAFDIKSERAETRTTIHKAYADHGVDGAETPAEALAGATAALSLVTADQALAAAEAGAPHLAPGAWWFDGNSCAPDTKRRAAAAVARHGGRYVDMAIMAPVNPLRLRVPVLLAGPDAAEGQKVLETLGFSPALAGAEVGQATAIKMIRSVMIKGIEALTAECFLAARRAGVEEAVLASLGRSDPQTDWPRRGAYNLERMMRHGARRAAEMREVAVTLADLGLPDGMTRACIDWQARIAAAGLEAGPEDLAARADAILGALFPDE